MTLQFSARGEQSRRSPPKIIELDLDTAGYIQGIDDSEFNTPKELGKLLAASNACHRCIVKQVFRYAFGREETEADSPVIDGLLEKFRESDFRFRELLVALVTSDLFLQQRGGE